MPSTTVELIAGIALLLLGRKLFWFFVGALGFLIGWHFASLYLQGQSESVILTVSLLCGAVGILLAIFVQKIAVALAGFLAGGYLALNFAAALGFATAGQISWVPFAIGGVLGAIVLSVLFGWALIVLSSVTGAVLIVQALHLHQTTGTVLTIVLCLVGIIVQARFLRGSTQSSERT